VLYAIERKCADKSGLPVAFPPNEHFAAKSLRKDGFWDEEADRAIAFTKEPLHESLGKRAMRKLEVIRGFCCANLPSGMQYTEKVTALCIDVTLLRGCFHTER
jgi:hypothetical protein